MTIDFSRGTSKRATRLTEDWIVHLEDTGQKTNTVKRLEPA